MVWSCLWVTSDAICQFRLKIKIAVPCNNAVFIKSTSLISTFYFLQHFQGFIGFIHLLSIAYYYLLGLQVMCKINFVLLCASLFIPTIPSLLRVNFRFRSQCLEVYIWSLPSCHPAWQLLTSVQLLALFMGTRVSRHTFVSSKNWSPVVGVC